MDVSDLYGRSAFGSNNHGKMVAAGKHRRENLVVVTKLAIERICLAIRALELNQTAGFARGDGPEQELIDEAENCNIDADSQRQRHHGYGGEAGIPLELAQAVANVLPQGFLMEQRPQTMDDAWQSQHGAPLQGICAQLPVLTMPTSTATLAGTGLPAFMAGQNFQVLSAFTGSYFGDNPCPAQDSLNSTSILTLQGTGFPAFMAGLNFQVFTASMAFSVSPLSRP